MDPGTHPPDEALGPLSGSPKRRGDEVFHSSEDAARRRYERGRPRPALLLFLLQFVTQALAFREVLLEEKKEIVGEALENGMALLGFEGAGPGLALVHLAFELMKNLLNVPAVLVEQDDLIGRKGEVVGHVGEDHSVLRIGHSEAAEVVAVHVHAEEMSGGDGA